MIDDTDIIAAIHELDDRLVKLEIAACPEGGYVRCLPEQAQAPPCGNDPDVTAMTVAYRAMDAIPRGSRRSAAMNWLNERLK